MTDDCDDRRRTSSGSPHGSEARSLDSLLEVLADERRRCLLAYLLDRDAATASLEAVTDGVLVELERRQRRRPEREVLAADLRHRHLPRLADVGVLEYDSRSQTVRVHGHERLEQLYERIRALEEE
ncbi:DUF7344 domain-containing protein [Natronococcus occultus]|uniref:DUF7344 domain-containing protein n=1 Tax=Natronococcus occultus SP4 TaxID=694430 RepID=L0JXM2_9EURY|nr:hypothetical protein [Natronococcus occultus]AGB36613.1 hypothetical protein Natoc_0756 [Natronococcus occultus SP4]